MYKPVEGADEVGDKANAVVRSVMIGCFTEDYLIALKFDILLLGLITL